jgi:RNA polymerase sigma-70 factor (ECF subfamily)
MSDSEHEHRRARFEDIALPIMPALYRLALHLTEVPEDAEDAVQETYYRAYRTFENFRPGTNAKAWLFTILRSVVINRWRKTRRGVRDVPIEPIEERYPDDQSDLASLGSPEVEVALRALPEVFRSAVLLVDVEELSYEEAAAVLDCPVGTLGSRLSRGRRILFSALHDFARRAGYARPTDP